MQGPSDQGGARDAVRIGVWVGVAAALALCLEVAPDVGYGDAGELGTAAVVLGVPHPTGFALDMLWLKAVSLVPLGSLPFRLGLGAALTGGFALGLCAAITFALAGRAGVRSALARGLGAVLAASGLYGFAVFAAATRSVEVYALALAAVLLGLYVAMTAARAPAVLALLAGLAAGMHVTAGLYVAPLLLMALARAPRSGRALVTAAPLALAGALVLAYLPLASRRDPAIDWGDPETLSGVIAHLSAERVRSAYQAEMFGGDRSAPLLLGEQLAPLSLLAALALFAALLSLVRGGARAPSPARFAAAVILALGALDVAYAVWVNPMGVRDLQCGHVAGACIAILGGAGAAVLVERLGARARGHHGPRRVLELALVTCALGQLALPRAARSERGEDGYALGELFGSGGPVAGLPPRAVFLCTTDHACAASMFALAVERVRPDVDSAPAQHLWDATVLRQLEGLSAPAAEGRAQRARRAEENTRRLLEGRAGRPVALETRKIAEAGGGVMLAPLAGGPFLTPAASAAPDAFARAYDGIERMLRARFGPPESQGAPAVPPDERAQVLWSRAFGELGAAALRAPTVHDGLVLLEAAAHVAPARATAWVNLGVGLEVVGQLDDAVEVTERAVLLEPARATGWVNLAHFELKRGQRQRARAALERAQQAGVRDARLDALRAQLDAPR